MLWREVGHRSHHSIHDVLSCVKLSAVYSEGKAMEVEQPKTQDSIPARYGNTRTHTLLS